MRKFGVVLFCGAAAGAKLDSEHQRQHTQVPPNGWDYPGYDETWDISGGYPVGNMARQWVCGNDAQRDEEHTANPVWSTTSEAAINAKAGFQLMRGPQRQGSLEWLKETDMRHVSEADRDSLWWRQSWDDLFCSDYVGGYLNPRAMNGGARGVCLRDVTPGHRWMSVVQADKEAKALWEYFGNVKGSIVVPLEAHHGGYQKASENFRELNNKSWNYRWGTGSWGSLPPNWCGNYMKQFLCHIAFPQYAGPAPSNMPAWVAGDTTPASHEEKMVRPVCDGFAETIMDACNRAEPIYDAPAAAVKKIAYPWLQRDYAGSGYFSGTRLQDLTQKIDKGEKADDMREFSETNAFWISVWNRGFGLSASGTGVGKGDDADVIGPEYSHRFCAVWEAGSTSVPALALVVIVSLLSVIAF